MANKEKTIVTNNTFNVDEARRRVNESEISEYASRIVRNPRNLEYYQKGKAEFSYKGKNAEVTAYTEVASNKPTKLGAKLKVDRPIDKYKTNVGANYELAYSEDKGYSHNVSVNGRIGKKDGVNINGSVGENNGNIYTEKAGQLRHDFVLNSSKDKTQIGFTPKIKQERNITTTTDILNLGVLNGMQTITETKNSLRHDMNVNKIGLTRKIKQEGNKTTTTDNLNLGVFNGTQKITETPNSLRHDMSVNKMFNKEIGAAIGGGVTLDDHAHLSGVRGSAEGSFGVGNTKAKVSLEAGFEGADKKDVEFFLRTLVENGVKPEDAEFMLNHSVKESHARIGEVAQGMLYKILQKNSVKGITENDNCETMYNKLSKQNLNGQIHFDYKNGELNYQTKTDQVLLWGADILSRVTGLGKDEVDENRRSDVHNYADQNITSLNLRNPKVIEKLVLFELLKSPKDALAKYKQLKETGFDYKTFFRENNIDINQGLARIMDSNFSKNAKQRAEGLGISYDEFSKGIQSFAKSQVFTILQQQKQQEQETIRLS